MSTFALDTSSSSADVISALNYAISNLGQGGTATLNGNVLTANTTTGQITTTTSNATGYTTTLVSYLYQYMDVKYSNSATGSSGFTSNCRQANYYGLRNTANATPISSNPADYIWYQVTDGFGVTKNLWYQTIGGRQVAFFAGNAAPLPNYIPVPDQPFANSAPLNLDSITSVQNNQIVNVNAYYQGNTAPATPSGGTYNFSTFTLTPPTLWSATIPAFVANTSIYVSQAAFVGNSIATVGPSTLWTTPAIYIEQFQGNTGPAGTRGFVPMGYVICSTDPATFTNPTDYSAAFAAARTNSSPPIGLGFPPITNDTAQFFYANLFTGTNTTTVRQFNGNIWINVDAQVVSGGLFVPGTITANTLNANEVYALTITGGNVTPGINSGYGYWLTANAGNAYFGGTVDVGNNLIVGQDAQFGSNLNIGTNAFISDTLTVGNNASIGNNLSVGTNATIGGVIIGGSLAANTVGNTQILPGLNGALLATGTVGSTQIGNDAIITGKIATNAITANTIQANAITVGKIAVDAVTANTIAANSITTGKIAANTITGNLVQANTIQGTSIVAGSITSTQLSANIIISGNIISFGQTIESPTGVGYWLDYTNGNVYFGGNTVIGNSLKIGNNPNIGTGLTVGASAVIGANLTVGSNAQIGANLNVGTNAVVGANLTVGSNAQIGANLNVGSSLKVGSFATIGSNLTVQDNASIGNNLSVGTNATIGGVIIGGVLGPNTVGNTQVAAGLNGGLIAGGTIGTTQIGSNAITTGLIAAGAITAGQIAAGSIYAGAIQAGAVTASTIAAGAVTASAISAGAITASAISAGAITAGAISANAITSGTVAANAITSYSLAANAVVAGTIAANAISAYSLQANSVTGNAINANTITTTNLVFNSQTGQTSKGPDFSGTYQVAFVNGTSNVATNSGYLWPYNTRGLAIEGGVSYIPTTTGNLHTNATSYSHISVVYSGYIFSANTANLVEIWKAGGSSYYAQSFNQIAPAYYFYGTTPRTYDQFYVVGNNNYWGYNINNGLTGSWSVNQDGSSGINNSPSIIYNSLTNMAGGTGPNWVNHQEVGGPSGTWYSTDSFGGPYGNVYYAPYYNNGYVSNLTKPITTYSQTVLNGSITTNNTVPYIIGVGSSGTIFHLSGFGTGWSGGASAVYETTNILQTFYGVASQRGQMYYASSSDITICVAVGSNGTIVQNTYQLAFGGGITAGTWTQKVSGTLSDLYAVASNAPYNGIASGSIQWVAVGQYGTILTSPDGNTWTVRTSPTTQNLNSVTYGNGYWVAVGNQSTIVYSTDGINWTAVQGPQGNDGVYRNLESVAYGYIGQSFNAVGQSIIMRATTPNTWSTTYDGGVSVTSQLTRLLTVGADGSNIANVTIPSQNQTIGSQQISGQYIDTNYSAGVTQTYYLVMGNLTGNIVSTNGATLVITEFKR